MMFIVTGCNAYKSLRVGMRTLKSGQPYRRVLECYGRTPPLLVHSGLRRAETRVFDGIRSDAMCGANLRSA